MLKRAAVFLSILAIVLAGFSMAPPESSPPLSYWSFAMPNLYGRDLHYAQNVLTGLGLPVDNLSIYSGDSAPAILSPSTWVITNQEPRPGEVYVSCPECYVTLVVIPLLTE